MSDDPRVRWKRVTELFQAALDQPVSERQAFLDGLAREDPEVAREVAALVDNHTDSSQFLEKPAFEIAPELLAEPRLAAGGAVGPYEIVTEIPGGGMGVVYLAEDTRLKRRVALKALPPGVAANERLRERLRREARAAAALSHPNIATVYALEQYDDDLFIVSEYVKGRTLREEFRDGALPFDLVVQTGVQIGRALDAAHRHGIVHRDLKPENVMRTDDGLIKLLDFGIARFDDSGMTGVQLTETGAILGTPAYMAPEQLEGGVVDARADQFALGLLLYEAATGQHPFHARHPAAIAARILSEEPRPLSGDSAVEIKFAAIVLRMMGKRPENRFASTADALAELEGVRDQLGVHTPAGTLRPITSRYSLSWWWRMHQISVTVVYALMCVSVWRVKFWIADPWGMLLFLVIVAAASLNGTLRLHLVFLERFNRLALDEQVRLSLPLIRLSDWVVAGLTLVTALAIARGHAAAAAGLAAVAMIVGVTFLLIEPATLAAAFPTRQSPGNVRAPR